MFYSFSVFVTLKAFRPIRSTEGLWDVAWGPLVLGEMDVTRVSPYRSGQGEPPVHMAWLHNRRQDFWAGGKLFWSNFRCKFIFSVEFQGDYIEAKLIYEIFLEFKFRGGISRVATGFFSERWGMLAVGAPIPWQRKALFTLLV